MMRRNKPSSQNNGGGYNNQHRRQRHHSGGGQNNGGGNRPRRNYSAAREKYLQQARDALASGDRVLAENYLQHAEHCYRMMVEEGYNPRQAQSQPSDAHSGGQPHQAGEPAGEQEPDDVTTASQGSALPSFITGASHAGHEPLEQAMSKPPVIVQNWEEQ